MKEEKKREHFRYKFIDFIFEYWGELLSVLVILSTGVLAAFIELGSENGKLLFILEGVLACLSIVVLLQMAGRRDIRKSLQLVLRLNKDITVSDIFSPTLVLDERLFEGADSVTFVGRSLHRSLILNLDDIFALLKRGVSVTVAFTDPDSKEALCELANSYHEKWTVGEHKERLKGSIATVNAVARFGGELFKLVLLQQVPRRGGVIVRKEGYNGVVIVEEYLASPSGVNPSYKVRETTDPRYFEAFVADLLSIVALGREHIFNNG